MKRSPGQLSFFPSGISSRLQAVSAVSRTLVWVSGLEGRWLRTEDAGTSWAAGVIEPELQIRDIDAFSASSAWALSSGPGADSRIYRTDDGGNSWQLQFQNEEPDGFFDCLAAWTDRIAFVYGDSVDGELRILRTEDAGANWSFVPQAALPAALSGEGGFAASGTCAAARGGGVAWIATGAAETARVLRSNDWGRSWTAVETPAVAGDGSGLTSLAFDRSVLFAVGGRIGDDRPQERRIVKSDDSGASWQARPEPPIAGPLYGSALYDGHLLVVGPGGAGFVAAIGESSRILSEKPFWSVAVREGRAWFCGPDGAVASLDLAITMLSWQMEEKQS